MNQEFNMKKLTALLLGTVISVAFTTDAFADPMAKVKGYFSSNDGKTGSYLGISGNEGSIDNVRANYAPKTESTWALSDGIGAKIQYGYDFGKIRFDWRVGGSRSNVDTIDGAQLEGDKSNDAALAYTTFNLGLDLYRFELINRGFVDIAITPYVGGGAGYGGGWMTGKKLGDGPGASNNRLDQAGHGFVYTYEAGVLMNLTDWAGVTLGYNYLHQKLNGNDVKSQMGEVGVRFTY
jgi:hypothetical protein